MLHRKRPRLLPLFDRAVVDWYRPVTGQRAAATAWAPLLAALREDLATPPNRTAILRDRRINPLRTGRAAANLIAGAYLVVLLPPRHPMRSRRARSRSRACCSRLAGLLRVVRDGVTQLVRGLSEAAHTDPLTGLNNRLALDQQLTAEVERALRADLPLSVVIGDLDHFKSVNDRLGHRAGDEALVRVGAILERHRRAGDSIARTGGEEFTILLPEATEHEAYLVSERLRTAVQREFHDDSAALTFSFGVATYPEHGRTADAVIEAADQALYAAKALGRNRCVIFNREIAAIFAPEAGRSADEVQLATLLSLAEALDLRDTGTADHSRSVGRYCGDDRPRARPDLRPRPARRDRRHPARHRQDRPAPTRSSRSRASSARRSWPRSAPTPRSAVRS